MRRRDRDAAFSPGGINFWESRKAAGAVHSPTATTALMTPVSGRV